MGKMMQLASIARDPEYGYLSTSPDPSYRINPDIKKQSRKVDWTEPQMFKSLCYRLHHYPLCSVLHVLSVRLISSRFAGFLLLPKNIPVGRLPTLSYPKVPFSGLPHILSIYLPHTQCSQDKPWIHHCPDWLG